jgi:ubiquinone/menaquinone biosynthesis C-methylase UbiE
VTGIDLTQEFVETGQVLCDWVGLREKIVLRQGSALDMPFEDECFDAAFMMHVGMNIPNKKALFAEVARTLKLGTLFGIYDVMRTGDGDLTLPVPWAETRATDSLEAPEVYKDALADAGFTIEAERNLRDFAVAFFEELSAKAATMQGPPPLGLHILMGQTRPEKIKNMVENIGAGRIAPIELIARK